MFKAKSCQMTQVAILILEHTHDAACVAGNFSCFFLPKPIKWRVGQVWMTNWVLILHTVLLASLLTLALQLHLSHCNVQPEHISGVHTFSAIINLHFSGPLKHCSCVGSRACAGCTICICRPFDTGLVCPLSLLSHRNQSLSLKCRSCAWSSLCRLWNLYT